MQFNRRSFLAGGAAAALLPSAWLQGGAQSSPDGKLKIRPKKGLAGAAPVASGLRTSWYYNWGSRPSTKDVVPAEDPSIRFVPMCWGWNQHFEQGLNALRPMHPPLLFGFNEPDHTDQSNLSVEAALAAWPRLQGVATELVGPSCAQPQGPWMQQFMTAADKQNLQVDSVGFHHYGSPDPHDFIGLLVRVHQMYGRPIWVTEFAPADWQAKPGGPKNRYTEKQVIEFIRVTCAYMEETPWVKGYAWYPWGKAGQGGPLSTSAFFDTAGSLTEAGQAYAAA